MTGLATAAPSEVGFDARGVLRFLDGVDALGLELHGLSIARHGRLLADAAWAPYSPTDLNLLYSVSKSFTSFALGIALRDHDIDLDARVVDLLPSVVPPSTALADLTVGDVARMATGHDGDSLPEMIRRRRETGADLVQSFFDIAPVRAPGTTFVYDNGATVVLAAVIRTVTGGSLVELLGRDVLRTLGVDEFFWRSFAPGEEEAFSGLHLRTRDLAAFGDLVLRDGYRGEEQLVAPRWAALAGSALTSTVDPTHSADWEVGYGLQFWVSRHGFRADGAYGQFVLILPEQDLVVVITSASRGEQPAQILDLAWQHLLPACDAPIDSNADAALADRLAALLHPPLRSEATHTPALGAEAPVDVTGPAPFSAVAVSAGDPHPVVTLHFADGDVAALPVGEGTWVSGSLAGHKGPVEFSSSGGWSEDGAYRARLRMIRTPHALTVRIGLEGASIAWDDPMIYGDDPRAYGVQPVRLSDPPTDG